MQNLNNFNNLKPISRVSAEQLPDLENAKGHATSKFSRFMSFVWTLVLITTLIYWGYMVISDDLKTRRQLKKNFEAIINSPEMQEYRAQEIRRQKEIERRKRLRKFNAKPVQKDDLLNEQLRKQEIAEMQGPEKPNNTLDYTQKLEIYRQANAGKRNGVKK